MASDCRSISLSGAPIEHNAVSRSHGLPCTAVETDLLSGPLGRHWGRFSLPGWLGESQHSLFGLWRRLRRLLGGFGAGRTCSGSCMA